MMNSEQSCSSGITHLPRSTYVSHNYAFLGRRVMQIPHVFYLDETNPSTSHRGTSLSFYCVLLYILHYWLFSQTHLSPSF